MRVPTEELSTASSPQQRYLLGSPFINVGRAQAHRTRLINNGDLGKEVSGSPRATAYETLESLPRELESLEGTTVEAN